MVSTQHSGFVYMHAQRIEVRTEQPSSFDKHMLGAAKYERATVFVMQAWQSNYAQSNRFYMRAPLNEVCTVQPFSICHARCCEVCTEHVCSSHRSMHGATVLYACSVQRSIHGATVFDMRSMHRAPGFDIRARCSEVCTEQPVLTCVLGAPKYARINRFI